MPILSLYNPYTQGTYQAFFEIKENLVLMETVSRLLLHPSAITIGEAWQITKV